MRIIEIKVGEYYHVKYQYEIGEYIVLDSRVNDSHIEVIFNGYSRIDKGGMFYLKINDGELTQNIENLVPNIDFFPGSMKRYLKDYFDIGDDIYLVKPLYDNMSYTPEEIALFEENRKLLLENILILFREKAIDRLIYT